MRKQERELSLKTRKPYVLSLAVLALALFFYLPPALVNEAPFWDDKAYINNALIASGRIEPSQAQGPYAEERPPLFWWFLTLLYSAGLPVQTARLISPLTVAAGLVAVFLLTSKIFRSLMTGFLTALTLAVHDYFIQTTSFILTDALGSILAFLTIATFSLGLRYGPYMWASGALLASAILARDQNLLLLPTIALSMVWIAKASKTLKLLSIAALILLAFTALYMTQEVFFQMISDAATVVLLDRAYLPFLALLASFTSLVVYKVSEQKNLISRKPSIEERFFDMLLAAVICLAVLHPFFLDNVRLGEEYQIEGRGVLSRPVAHSIMVRNDIAKMGLNTYERVSIWFSATLQLITIPILVLSVLGSILVLRDKVVQAQPLIVWAAVSIPYVFFFTHIEYRFLAQAVPPLVSLAAYAITRIKELNKAVGFFLAAATVVLAAVPSFYMGLVPAPSEPAALNGWKILLGVSTASERWLSNYIEYLEDVMKQPQPEISPLNILSACAMIPAIASAVYLGFRQGLEH